MRRISTNPAPNFDSSSAAGEPPPGPSSPRESLRARAVPFELPPRANTLYSRLNSAADALLHAPIHTVFAIEEALPQARTAVYRAGAVALQAVDDAISISVRQELPDLSSLQAPALPETPTTWLEDLRSQPDHRARLDRYDPELMAEILVGVGKTATLASRAASASVEKRLWAPEEAMHELWLFLDNVNIDVCRRLSESTTLGAPPGLLDADLQYLKDKLAEVMRYCQAAVQHEEGDRFRLLHEDIGKIWRMVYNVRASDELTALMELLRGGRSQQITLIP